MPMMVYKFQCASNFWQLVQQLVQANNKENITVPREWPFATGAHRIIEMLVTRITASSCGLECKHFFSSNDNVETVSHKQQNFAY